MPIQLLMNKSQFAVNIDIEHKFIRNLEYDTTIDAITSSFLHQVETCWMIIVSLGL